MIEISQKGFEAFKSGLYPNQTYLKQQFEALRRVPIPIPDEYLSKVQMQFLTLLNGDIYNRGLNLSEIQEITKKSSTTVWRQLGEKGELVLRGLALSGHISKGINGSKQYHAVTVLITEKGLALSRAWAKVCVYL